MTDVIRDPDFISCPDRRGSGTEKWDRWPVTFSPFLDPSGTPAISGSQPWEIIIAGFYRKSAASRCSAP